jgi:HK97 family phage prohead protease
MQGIAERVALPFGSAGLEMRAKPNGTGGTAYTFEGYAAVFDAPFEMWDMWGDPYTEVLNQGCFTRTLANSADVAFLIGHNDAGILLARTKSGTLMLSQDTHGLLACAPDLDGGRDDVRALYSAVQRGDQDEMSCAFYTRQQVWSPDFTQRNMVELDLNRGDVSSVVFGANDATAGASMRSMARAADKLTLRRPVAAAAAQLAARPPARAAGVQHLAQDEIVDMSGAPDYNPVPHQFDPAAIACTTAACAAAGVKNSPDARYCDQCGEPMYGSDGLMVLDDSGAVTEVQNSEGDAALLSRQREAELLAHRQRELALLALTG